MTAEAVEMLHRAFYWMAAHSQSCAIWADGGARADCTCDWPAFKDKMADVIALARSEQEAQRG